MIKSLSRKAGLTVVGWVQPTDVRPWHLVGCTHPTDRPPTLPGQTLSRLAADPMAALVECADSGSVVVVELPPPPLDTAQAMSPPATAPASTPSHLFLEFILISIVVADIRLPGSTE